MTADLYELERLIDQVEGIREKLRFYLIKLLSDSSLGHRSKPSFYVVFNLVLVYVLSLLFGYSVFLNSTTNEIFWRIGHTI
jgi:type VI protein secretion system component VasF